MRDGDGAGGRAERGPARDGLPAPGDLVGDYRLQALLGKGGMGAVYRGAHRTTGHAAAIKVMLVDGDESERFAARFRREAEAMAKVDRHAGVVRIRASGVFGPRALPYAVMDFVAGSDLAKELRAGPMPVPRALAVVAKVARAIHHCHEQGVLHRDLKPANVLIRAEDHEPLLTDFGLAKDETKDALTRTGEVLGTPAYMAPEQAEGQSREQDRRTDVYGLGAILYECLAGEPPFKADSPLGLVKKVLLEDAKDPSAKRAGVPSDAGVIALRCLAKEKEHRYATALEVAEELERLHAGEPILARPIGRAEAWKRRARRQPKLAALVLLAVLAVLLATGYVAVLALRALEGASSATAEKVESRKEALRLEGLARDELGLLGYPVAKAEPAALTTASALVAKLTEAEARAGEPTSHGDLCRLWLSLLEDPARVLAREPGRDVSLVEGAAACAVLRAEPTNAAARALLDRAAPASGSTSGDAAFLRAFAQCQAKPSVARLADLCAAARPDARSPWRLAHERAWIDSIGRAFPGAGVGRTDDLARLVALLGAAADVSLPGRIAAWIGTAEPDFFARFPREKTAVEKEPVVAFARLLRRERAPGFEERLHAFKTAEVARAAELVLDLDPNRIDWERVGKTSRILAALLELTDQPVDEALPLFQEVGYKAAMTRGGMRGHMDSLFPMFAISLASGCFVTDFLSRAELGDVTATPRAFLTKEPPAAERRPYDVVVDLAAAVAWGFTARAEIDQTSPAETPAKKAAYAKALAELRAEATLERALRDLADPGLAFAPAVRERLVAVGRFERALQIAYGLATQPAGGELAVSAAVVSECEAVLAVHPRPADVRRFLCKAYVHRAELLEKTDPPAALRACDTAAEACAAFRAFISATREEHDRLCDATERKAQLRLAELRLGGAISYLGDPMIVAQSFWIEAWAREVQERMGDAEARAKRREALRSGLEVNPKEVLRRRQLAEILEAEGKLEEALRVVKRCFELEPGEEIPPGLGEAKAQKERLEGRLAR